MRHELVEKFQATLPAAVDEIRGLRSILSPPPPVDIVDWIESNIVLPAESSATKNAPFLMYGYQKALARLMATPGNERFAVLKSVRCGITQLVTAMSAYHVAYEGRPTALWQPTDGAAKEYYRKYWEPTFRRSPNLRKLIRHIRKGDVANTWNDQTYTNGGTMFLRWASAPDSFRQITACNTVGDEFAAKGWDDEDKNSQGDKGDLMHDRSMTFFNRKQYLFSSPLREEDCRIWKRWLKSDQRRWFVRCPECERRFFMCWGGVHHGNADDQREGLRYTIDGRSRVTSTWYQCKTGCVIDEGLKNEMDEIAGNAIYAEDDPTPVDERLGLQPTAIPEEPDLIGVHLPIYICLFDGAAWKKVAQKEVDALGSPRKYQKFVNTYLGEPSRDQVVAAPRIVGSYGQSAHVHAYEAEIPEDAICMTASFDPQDGWEKIADLRGRVEGQVVAWGPGAEAYSVGYFVLQDDHAFSATTARQIDAILARRWKKPSGAEMNIHVATFDAGWKPESAIAFCRGTMWRNKVLIPTKGLNETDAERKPIVQGRWVPNDARNRLAMIGTQAAKDLAARYLWNDTEGPGYVHFPSAMESVVSYFFNNRQGLFAEQLLKDATGREYWARKNDGPYGTGEVWDTWVGNIVAMKFLELAFPSVGRLLSDMTPPASRVKYTGDDRSLMAAIKSHRNWMAQQMEAMPVTIAPPEVQVAKGIAIGPTPAIIQPIEADRPIVGRSSYMSELGF